MDNRPIAFLDSGVGGLPYLDWARERLPDETFVYLADRANFPYGPKPRERILEAVRSAVSGLLCTVNPKMIVIACNTATVVALATLRSDYPDFPFVGVVPAIKPASLQSVHRKIGVLATRQTVEGQYLKNLIAEFAPDCLVVKVAGGNIVEFVEQRLLDAPKQDRYGIFHAALQEFMESGVDSVVLGCTHFLYLSEEIREKLDPGIAIIDSREGVGKQIMRLLSRRNLGATERGEDRLFVTGTGPVEERYLEFAKRFSLRCAGTLECQREFR